MARQDKDGLVDPALVATWRRMLWLMRGSADVLEALVPAAAGLTKDEISRLLARAGAPSGEGVEPVEQVLGLLGVVPRARYDALRAEHDALLAEYEELGGRVGEAEQSIERLRRLLRDQGLVDEAEPFLDAWGGLVRRTLRAQAGFMRSISNVGGPAPGPTPPAGEAAPATGPPEAPATGDQAAAAEVEQVAPTDPAPQGAPQEREPAAPEEAELPRPAASRAATTRSARGGARTGRSKRPG